MADAPKLDDAQIRAQLTARRLSLRSGLARLSPHQPQWLELVCSAVRFAERTSERGRKAAELVLHHLAEELLAVAGIKLDVNSSEPLCLLELVDATLRRASRPRREAMLPDLVDSLRRLVESMAHAGEYALQERLLRVLLRFVPRGAGERHAAYRSLFPPKLRADATLCEAFCDYDFRHSLRASRLFLSSLNKICGGVEHVLCVSACVDDVKLHPIGSDPNDSLWLDLNLGPGSMTLQWNAAATQHLCPQPLRLNGELLTLTVCADPLRSVRVFREAGRTLMRVEAEGIGVLSELPSQQPSVLMLHPAGHFKDADCALRIMFGSKYKWEVEGETPGMLPSALPPRYPGVQLSDNEEPPASVASGSQRGRARSFKAGHAVCGRSQSLPGSPPNVSATSPDKLISKLKEHKYSDHMTIFEKVLKGSDPALPVIQEKIPAKKIYVKNQNKNELVTENRTAADIVNKVNNDVLSNSQEIHCENNNNNGPIQIDGETQFYCTIPNELSPTIVLDLEENTMDVTVENKVNENVTGEEPTVLLQFDQNEDNSEIEMIGNDVTNSGATPDTPKEYKPNDLSSTIVLDLEENTMDVTVENKVNENVTGEEPTVLLQFDQNEDNSEIEMIGTDVTNSGATPDTPKEYKPNDLSFTIVLDLEENTMDVTVENKVNENVTGEEPTVLLQFDQNEDNSEIEMIGNDVSNSGATPDTPKEYIPEDLSSTIVLDLEENTMDVTVENKVNENVTGEEPTVLLQFDQNEDNSKIEMIGNDVSNSGATPDTPKEYIPNDLSSPTIVLDQEENTMDVTVENKVNDNVTGEEPTDLLQFDQNEDNSKFEMIGNDVSNSDAIPDTPKKYNGINFSSVSERTAKLNDKFKIVKNVSNNDTVLEISNEHTKHTKLGTNHETMEKIGSYITISDTQKGHTEFNLNLSSTDIKSQSKLETVNEVDNSDAIPDTPSEHSEILSRVLSVKVEKLVINHQKMPQCPEANPTNAIKKKKKRVPRKKANATKKAETNNTKTAPSNLPSKTVKCPKLASPSTSNEIAIEVVTAIQPTQCHNKTNVGNAQMDVCLIPDSDESNENVTAQCKETPVHYRKKRKLYSPTVDFLVQTETHATQMKMDDELLLLSKGTRTNYTPLNDTTTEGKARKPSINTLFDQVKGSNIKTQTMSSKNANDIAILNWSSDSEKDFKPLKLRNKRKSSMEGTASGISNAKRGPELSKKKINKKAPRLPKRGKKNKVKDLMKATETLVDEKMRKDVTVDTPFNTSLCNENVGQKINQQEDITPVGLHNIEMDEMVQESNVAHPVMKCDERPTDPDNETTPSNWICDRENSELSASKFIKYLTKPIDKSDYETKRYICSKNDIQATGKDSQSNAKLNVQNILETNYDAEFVDLTNNNDLSVIENKKTAVEFISTTQGACNNTSNKSKITSICEMSFDLNEIITEQEYVSRIDATKSISSNFNLTNCDEHSKSFKNDDISEVGLQKNHARSKKLTQSKSVPACTIFAATSAVGKRRKSQKNALITASPISAGEGHPTVSTDFNIAKSYEKPSRLIDEIVDTFSTKPQSGNNNPDSSSCYTDDEFLSKLAKHTVSKRISRKYRSKTLKYDFSSDSGNDEVRIHKDITVNRNNEFSNFIATKSQKHGMDREFNSNNNNLAKNSVSKRVNETCPNTRYKRFKHVETETNDFGKTKVCLRKPKIDIGIMESNTSNIKKSNEISLAKSLENDDTTVKHENVVRGIKIIKGKPKVKPGKKLFDNITIRGTTPPPLVIEVGQPNGEKDNRLSDLAHNYFRYKDTPLVPDTHKIDSPNKNKSITNVAHSSVCQKSPGKGSCSTIGSCRDDRSDRANEKSFATNSKSPIRAHGDFNELPPNIAHLDNNVSGRHLEGDIENCNDRDYILKFLSERDNSENGQTVYGDFEQSLSNTTHLDNKKSTEHTDGDIRNTRDMHAQSDNKVDDNDKSATGQGHFKSVVIGNFEDSEILSIASSSPISNVPSETLLSPSPIKNPKAVYSSRSTTKNICKNPHSLTDQEDSGLSTGIRKSFRPPKANDKEKSKTPKMILADNTVHKQTSRNKNPLDMGSKNGLTEDNNELVNSSREVVDSADSEESSRVTEVHESMLQAVVTGLLEADQDTKSAWAAEVAHALQRWRDVRRTHRWQREEQRRREDAEIEEVLDQLKAGLLRAVRRRERRAAARAQILREDLAALRRRRRRRSDADG